MKRFILAIAILLIPAILPAQQSTWQWLNPLPQGNLINGLWAISPDSVIAVANGGTIIRTSNGGATWQVQYNAGGSVDPLYAVFFISGTVGWVAGESGTILKTTDAGATWILQTTPLVNNLFALHFASPTTGWAVGLFGTILKTTDAGNTWNQQVSHTTETLYGIQFRSLTRGWAVGANGAILSTTDGGTTWVKRTSSTLQSLYAVQFLSDNVGCAAGSFGTMLRTTDGGISWTSMTSNTSFSMYSLHFPTVTTGWAVGAYGDVIKTTNSGLTWTRTASASYNDLFSVRFYSSQIGWAMGDFGTIVKTTDGGISWILQSTGIQNTLTAIHFPTLAYGWAVGDEGTIAHSTDGGLTWFLQSSKTILPLYGIHMINDLIGWAVGDSAMILKTTNGGTTWTDQNSHTDIILYSAFFQSPSLGWVVGDGGTILHTTSGTSWTPQTTDTYETLLKVQFYDAYTGYVVGSNGAILKTIDGGSNWTSLLSPTSATLYGLSILNQNTVVVSGDYGVILKTTDGGGTWSDQTVDMFTTFYSLDFYSSSVGWAVGDGGEIINTNNGGLTWSLQSTGTENQLWDVQVLPTAPGGGVVYAAGEGGTLLYSNVSPLQVRTWTGIFDSSWTNAANWNPIGLPDKGDSVIIPSTPNQPVHRTNVQQINIGALQINSGARLTIRAGLAQLLVKGTVNIDGTLDVDQNSNLEIISGGNFATGSGGIFKPGKSTVIFTNLGFVRGTFYNLFLTSTAYVISTGNINVSHTLTTFSSLQMGISDTLRVLNPQAQAVQGTGFINGGTILRAITPGSTETYRFESPATTVRFYPTGTLPDSLTVTTFLNYPPGQPDSLFVKRYYSFSGHNGSNYLYQLTLRYDTTETQIPIDNLALFRDSSGILTNVGITDYTDTTYNLLVLDSLRSLWKWLIGKDTYYPVHPYQYIDTLIVTNNALQSDTLEFGALPGATDGIDILLGEITLGPIPPSSTMDARFLIPSTYGTVSDFRDILTIGHPLNTYTMRVQPGSGGYPITVRWNQDGFAPGAVLLTDSATHGALLSVNMKLQNSCVITGPSTSTIVIQHHLPPLFAFGKGWNMLSLPVKPFKSSKRIDLFPTAISRAFDYANGYHTADTLGHGKGYWLKFAADQSIALDGLNLTLDTFTVAAGWNMIGSIASRIPVTAITQVPSSIVASKYFTYKSSYSISDSILPAKGYWVKVTAPGKLIVSGASQVPSQLDLPAASRELESFNTLTITDHAGSEQTLFFSANGPGIIEQYELPPLPPEGVFDARFTSNTVAGRITSSGNPLTLALQNAVYPVSLSWHLNEQQVQSLLARNAGNGSVITKTDLRDGTLRIEDPSIKTIALSHSERGPVPAEFALHQNFPNPFNPSTSIRFDLPSTAHVTLRIFNLLGQEVTRLADNRVFEAGSHTLTLNASNLSAGVYFYRLTARDTGPAVHDETKKMLIIK